MRKRLYEARQRKGMTYEDALTADAAAQSVWNDDGVKPEMQMPFFRVFPVNMRM